MKRWLRWLNKYHAQVVAVMVGTGAGIAAVATVTGVCTAQARGWLVSISMTAAIGQNVGTVGRWLCPKIQAKADLANGN